MAGSRRRRQLRQQRQQFEEDATPTATNREPAAADDDVRVNVVARLPPDLLSEIHHQLTSLDRVAFALVCRRSGHTMKPDARRPWLVAPTAAEDKARLVSVADGRDVAVPTCDPAMRGHVVVGSSLGWLVTADARGALRAANPVTGAQADLPSIATMVPAFARTGFWFTVDTDAFARARFAAGGKPPVVDPAWGTAMPRSITLTADQMRDCFYRKVVLSSSPRSGTGYVAMLVLRPAFGAPAFATSEDPTWRVAPSRDGVEDAVFHDGRFYSLTYSGVVEAWDRNDDGSFKSTVVAPKLNVAASDGVRKYLAVAPDGRFVIVLKQLKQFEVDIYKSQRWRPVFKAYVLDEPRQRWEDAPAGVPDAALFVGVNSSLCVPAEKGRRVRSGCVYFTDDDGFGKPSGGRGLDREDANEEMMRCVGVYSLRDRRWEKIIQPQDDQPRWPPPVWFTPSVV